MKLTIEQALQQGIAVHRAGKLEEAERLYRVILQSQPAHPDANHNLGVIAVSINKADVALPLFKTALEANPKIELFWLSYIDALIKEKQFDNAKQALNQADKQGVAAEKLNVLEKQLTTIVQVNEPKLAVQIKRLSLSQKLKKLSEQKKRKKIARQNLKTNNPSQQQLSSLLEYYQTGRFNDAEKLAVTISKDFPNHPFSWTVLGAVLETTGRKLEALDAHQTAVTLSPQDAAANYNLGNSLKELGRLDEALASYTQAIILKPDFAQAHYNLGNTLTELGRLDESLASYTQAIAFKPDFAQAHFNLGNTLKELVRLDEALASYTQAIAFKPDYAKAHFNLGNTLTELERLDEALASYTQAIALKPDYAEAHVNLGITLQELERLDEALASYTQAIALKPDYAEAHSNLGNTFRELGKLDDALASHTQAIAFKPDFAQAHSNFGFTLHDLGKFEEAIQFYKKAIELNPNFAIAHHNLSYTFLSYGMLKEGFNEYEWRWQVPKLNLQQRNFIHPLWDGKTTLKDKSILLWCEQGIGDTINWSSCLSIVTSRAKHVILECQKKLVPLLSRSFPNVEVKAENRSLDADRDDFDLHLPMGSLYKHFIDEIIENGKASSYLVPDPDRVNYWRERLNSLGKGPYIGISWKSSNMSVKRLPNYSSISEWSEILSIPNVTFINLQSKDFEDDLAKVREEPGVTVHNFDDLDQWNNIDDVAALCTAIDIIICNHGTVPLISGGVGTATKLANWRQSSWNTILHNPAGPSVDIFERDTIEPWDNVFSLIKQEILKLNKNWSS
jgi:tetratricopeptide (TPR) repeat protein